MNRKVKAILFLPWLISQLPLRVLYMFSDLFYLILYYIIQYRKKLVKRQMSEAFPEWEEQELKKHMKAFYRTLCDYVVETIWMAKLKPEQIKRRVVFDGFEEIQREMEERCKQFGFFYLGHYGNWEWLASFAMSSWEGTDSAQIYHKLHNKPFNDFFFKLREQFGGKCIPMKETLRHILMQKRTERKMIVGFIGDQCPKYAASRHWTEFLNHKTAFHLGTEMIGRKVDALIAYVHVTRPKRGYYHCRLQTLTWDPQSEPMYSITDQYAQLIEQQIRENPELWLWTHNRWKRTYEEWLKLNTPHEKHHQA